MLRAVFNSVITNHWYHICKILNNQIYGFKFTEYHNDHTLLHELHNPGRYRESVVMGHFFIYDSWGRSKISFWYCFSKSLNCGQYMDDKHIFIFLKTNFKWFSKCSWLIGYIRLPITVPQICRDFDIFSNFLEKLGTYFDNVF